MYGQSENVVKMCKSVPVSGYGGQPPGVSGYGFIYIFFRGMGLAPGVEWGDIGR